MKADAHRCQRGNARRKAATRASGAARQRVYRARQHNRERVYRVGAGEIVHAALVARSIDAGLSVEAAEREGRNPQKVSVDLTEVLLQWAQRYLAERKKMRDA